MKMNREILLQRLLAVEAGTSPREVNEQSSCFVFKNGYIITFNNTTCCKWSSLLDKEFEGAVKAKPLISLLQKLPDEELDIFFKKECFIVGAFKKRTDLKLEKEILLGYTVVEKPGGWHPLPDNFNDALQIVIHCVGKDQSKPKFTCVHFTPKHIEASDNFQMTRYKIKCGFNTPSTLIPGESLKPMVPMGMTEFSETDNWLHFRNPDKLTFSCRKMISEVYLDLSPCFDVIGEKTSLPKSIAESVGVAEIFSAEGNDNYVSISLIKGQVRILGSGASGKHQEIKDVPSYKGPPKTFHIIPALLMELVKRHNEVIIGEHQLLVNGGKWSYAVYLEVPEEKSNG